MFAITEKGDLFQLTKWLNELLNSEIMMILEIRDGNNKKKL